MARRRPAVGARHSRPAVGLLPAALVGAGLLLAGVGGVAAVLVGVFSAQTASGSTLSFASLDSWLPSGVTSSRVTSTTCQVSWTPDASAPVGATYDVTDGASTVASDVAGTTTVVTVGAGAVTPVVKLRVGTWVSSSGTSAGSACLGWPDAPVVTLTPTQTQLAATWTAPAGNGASVASYSATISPVGTGTSSCSVVVPASRSCVFTGLTDGVGYTVSVTATSSEGTGPAGTATAIPYPSTVMTGAATELWLDGADTGTLFASSSCSGAAASSTLGCWKDKSDNGNNATQPTGSLQPTLTSSGLPRSAPGFDGTNDELYLTPSLLPTGSTSSTQFHVVQLTDPAPAASSYRTVLAWGQSSNGKKRIMAKNASSAALFADAHGGSSSVPGSLTTGRTTLVESEYTASQIRTGMDGYAWLSPAATTVNTGTSYAYLGSVSSNFFWQGPIPEVIVLTGTVSDADRRTVEEYLARKWSLTITPQAPTAVTVSPTAAGTSADVAWTAPSWNGGSVVTGYTVTAVPAAGGGNVTCTAVHPSTSCTLSGLAGAGAQYTVTVTASNVVGTGPASTSTTLFAGLPVTTNLKLWLDGADAASMYASSACSGGAASTTVGCWKDKSGQAAHATQSTPAAQPALATLSGRSVPSYDGSDDWLSFNAALLPTGTTSSTEFVVATHADPTDVAYSTVLDWGNATSNQARSLYKNAVTGAVRFDNRLSGVTESGVWATTPTLAAAEAAGGGTTLRSATNGVAWTAPTSASFSTGSGAGAVGASVAGTTWHGDVAEVVVVSGTLTTTEKRQVEEYLATKWGITIAPSAPQAASATPGNASATVSWTAPASNGGSAITSYTVTPVGGPGSCTWSAGTSASCTGLTNGTSYTFTVAAVNAVGTGTAATTAAVTPVSVPGAPTAVAATADDTVSSVSWTAPASDGGSAITSYTATAVPSDGTLATKTCSSASSPCSLSGLTNGVTYTVSVTATNAVGTGSASSSTTVIPYPETIMTGGSFKLWLDGADSSNVLASSGCTGAAATSSVGCWKDKSGSANNAVASTAAAVGSTMNGRSTIAFNGTAQLSLTRPALSDSTTYAVVRTSQSLGVGDGSAQWWAGASVLDGDVAGAATADGGFTLVGGHTALGTGNPDTTATAQRTMNDGTAHIMSGLRVSAAGTLTASSDGTATATATGAITGPLGSTPVYLGKSANATPYIGDIGEIISVGTALSAADQRTILEYLARKWGGTITPSAPASASATAGNTIATVSFSAPAWNGGAGVTSYTVTPVGGAGSCTWSSGTTASCTGLSNGTSYTFTVAAVNSVGTGPITTTAAVTPVGPPGAPTSVAATADDTVSSVSWTAPASTGGSAITSYTATAVPSDGTLATKTCTGSSSPCTLSGLTNGALYTVSVTATNAAGTGSASTSTTVTPYPKGIMTGATLNLWLDGADSSTLYASSACSGAAATTTIGCWADKSASANNATQAGAANRPTLSTLNSRVSPTFDGTDDYANLTVAKMVTGTNPSGIYVVAVQEDTAPASSCFRHAIGWGAAGSGGTRVVEKGCNNSNAFVETYDSWMSVASPPTWPVSSAALINGTVTSSSVTASMNGASAYSISYTNNTGTASGAQLGQSPWGGGGWKGRIAEVVVLAANPTASQNRQIQEYLARKWGMTITPSAPQSASAVAGTSTATVSWSAPAWNGGASVTSYTVAPVSGAGTCTWSSGTTASCTGLTHGASYTFTVTATNSVGAGPSVTTAAVTP